MRKPPIVLFVVLVLMATGCFEEPIREQVHLTMLGGEAAVVTTVLEISPPEIAGSNAALAARLDEARAEMDGGWDRWRPLYDRLDADAESYRLERIRGMAQRSIYSALVPSFSAVEGFLASQGLAPAVFVDGQIHRLELSPTGGTQASWSQRQLVERTLNDWSVIVADYLESSIELWGYLDDHPERATACFCQLFDSHGTGSGPLDPEEEKLVTALSDAMQRVADVLMVPDGWDYSPNELSRLAYDPFPTRLTVSVAGQILDSEGFVQTDGALERPPVDLWQALISLEGRWLTPDPVTAAVTPNAMLPEIDAAAFASLPRWASTSPSASEVADALASGLTPLDLHTVRWTTAGLELVDLEAGDPRRFLTAAEAGLPR
jgi:hypothetical protein